MSHPTFWPKKTFFYPIGNTPPVCLTDHLPPEVDAKILLLGCGDPRNILYTVNVDHGSSTRLIDITCCDWEPAIIARDVLLLTFIADGVESTRLSQYWSIFYDLFLSKAAVSLLKEQCIKLAGFATDMATWNSSSYGRFLKFLTEDSLNEARRHWDSYTETLSLPDPKQNELKQMFLSQMKEKMVQGSDMTSVFAAAPLSFQFPSKPLKTYARYWKSGITSPNVDSNGAMQINPTFLFSMAGRNFNLHYGTDLCSSFHLALALTKVTFDGAKASTPAKTEDEVWTECRTQFSRWSTAFHKKVGASNTQTRITIRFVVGDALAFCDGMKLCQVGDFTPSVYTSAWGASKFSFHDKSMPTFFNVVDSSNLSDHLGLLNILVSTVPLLQKSPYTVLHTNSLLSYKNHPTQRSAIEERALLDFPSLALFLGITPICYSSGLSFRNGCESASLAMMTQGRHYERISWKFSDFTHAEWNGTPTQRRHEVRFNSVELADKLFSVYLNMFENENFGSLFHRLQVGDTSLATIQNPHYHRQSFVRFLNLVRAGDHVQTDWSQTLDRFLDRAMTNNSLLIGSNNYQNLFADLHMWGIHSAFAFNPGFVTARYGSRPVPFQEWDTIPPVVCVVLKVPRSALKPVEELHEDEVGHPVFQCETYSKFHNLHSSVRPIFGDIVDAPGSKDRKVIVEDTRGLNGNSSLIVSFYVSAWILAEDPDNLEVGLGLKSTPRDSLTFSSKLGPSLRLFSSKLSNRDNVFILPERPDNQGELRRVATMNASPPQVNATATLGATAVSFKGETGNAILSKRLDVTASGAKEALVNKAPVDVKQTAPCCIEIAIKDYRYSLFYPIPVDGTRSKTRIARKSSYVEVDVPARTSSLTQLTLQPFPMTLSASGNIDPITCWNAPYINLDAFPTISPSGDLKWINTHVGMSLSRTERRLQHTASAETWGPIMNFKMSIGNIFLRYASDQVKVHVLQDPSFSRPHAILLLPSIRFDLSSTTIVGDAAVIIPTLSAMNVASRYLNGSAMATVSTYGEEVRLWKHALPILAERCRQWQHLPTCEYKKYGRVPRSVEYDDSPLCSCGKGKNLGPLLKNDRWKELAPYATRIALGPVFPVPYLEDVTEGSFETMLRDVPNFPVPRSQAGGVPGLPGFPGFPGMVRQEGRDKVVDSARCSRCGGGGKPKLLQCSACQSVKYCSKDCQTTDWKSHKHICKMLGKKST